MVLQSLFKEDELKSSKNVCFWNSPYKTQLELNGVERDTIDCSSKDPGSDFLGLVGMRACQTQRLCA